MLRKTVSVSDVLCCEVCKTGVTGGALAMVKGEIVSKHCGTTSPPENGPDKSGKWLVVHATCEQETHIHIQKGGRTSDTNRTLTRRMTFHVLQPSTGQRLQVESCPCCGRKLTINIKSYERAREDARKWATAGVVGVPLFLIFAMILVAMILVNAEPKAMGMGWFFRRIGGTSYHRHLGSDRTLFDTVLVLKYQDEMGHWKRLCVVFRFYRV